MKLLISIGHGGGDGGAVYNGTSEWKECSVVADRLKKLLDGKVSCQIVPDGRLPARIKWINNQSAELLLELHLDSAPSASGSSVFYMAGTPAKTPATRFAEIYASVVGLKNRGAKQDTDTRHGRLGIVRDTRPLAFLVELGFIQNDTEKVRENGAVALATAVLDFFKIPMDNLADWEKQALAWADEAINFKQENPRNPMTRVEVAEALRKLFIYIKETWKQ